MSIIKEPYFSESLEVCGAMDNNYEGNLKQALEKLQESLNELVTNAYLSGYQDGRKLGLKINGKEASSLAEDKSDLSTENSYTMN